MQREPAGITEGEGAQVLDEPVEGVRLIAQQREMSVIVWMDAVELRFHLRLQHCERRAQLVGDVGEEPAPGVLGGVELCGHRR